MPQLLHQTDRGNASWQASPPHQYRPAGTNSSRACATCLPACSPNCPSPPAATPQIQQEIARLALSALASQTIEALAADGDHPNFTPSLNNYLTICQPNADTSYRSAQIAAGGVYRLRGRKGALKMVRIAQSGPPPKPAADGQPILGPHRIDHDLNALQEDANGNYDVILSVERPSGYTGDWWPLLPNSNRLLVRLVSSDWANEVAPSLSIERLDRPATRLRPSAAALEQKLRALPHSIASSRRCSSTMSNSSARKATSTG